MTKKKEKELFAGKSSVFFFFNYMLKSPFAVLSFLSFVFPREWLAPFASTSTLFPSSHAHLSSHLSAHSGIQQAWTLSGSCLEKKAKLSTATAVPTH